MSKIEEREYWVPEDVREYLRGLGFVLPLEAMESHIRNWHAWMSATGDFYDYRDCTKPLRGSLPIVRLTWAAHAGRMAAPDHRIELCGYNRPERRRPCSNPFYPKSCPTSS